MKSTPVLFSILAGCNLVCAEQTGPPRRLVAGDYEKNRVAIIDAKGGVEWEYKMAGLHDLQVLPNGHLLFQDGWTHVIEVTPDAEKKIVWEYDSAKLNGNEGKPVEVHAFQRLENGNTMIAESGPSRIIEVAKDGTIKKEIKLKVAHSDAHRDTRQARKLANGHYLVAQEMEGIVREYDGDGKVVWEFPIPMFGREAKGGHGPEAFGNSVFGISRLANGNTLIGSGNGHSVLEVTPDKQIVWKLEQNDLPGIQLAWVCGVERLPNGNTFFVNCHAGPVNPQLIEVSPDKKVVWSFKDFDHFGNATPVGHPLGAK